MTALRNLDDQPFFMANFLAIADLGMWQQYNAAVDAVFKRSGGEAVYAGRLRGAPVPVKGDGIDTSDYNVLLLVKYPSSKAFLEFIDSPEYQAAYHLRLGALEHGKSTLITSFPMGGSATLGLATKVPGAAD